MAWSVTPGSKVKHGLRVAEDHMKTSLVVLCLYSLYSLRYQRFWGANPYDSDYGLYEFLCQ